jgi:hypothetical protein
MTILPISKYSPATDGSGYGVSHPQLGLTALWDERKPYSCYSEYYFAIYGGIQLSPKTKANRRFQIPFSQPFSISIRIGKMAGGWRAR